MKKPVIDAKIGTFLWSRTQSTLLRPKTALFTSLVGFLISDFNSKIIRLFHQPKIKILQIIVIS
ncbi:MAG: hypothetical protein FWG51_03765 [Firmicutes bacterium]|nr:hypothetical protein [Bacillota bacterium]